MRSEIADHLLHTQFVPGLLERPQEANSDRFDVLPDEAPDRVLGLGFIERHHDFAEAVDALGQALDETLRHDRHRLPALGKVHDLADVARGHSARAAHNVDGILVAARRDQADARSFSLEERIRADGRSVSEHRDVAAEPFEGKTQAIGRQAHRREHALGEILRRRRRFGRGNPAAAVERNAVGEGAADVDADQ